jgi:hypothetical protein
METQYINYQSNPQEDIDFLILISKYNAEKITTEEQSKLDELIARSRINMRLFQILTDKKNRTPLQNVINNL